MSEYEYKICPRCKTTAALTAPRCQVCGREYNTQFVVSQGTPPQVEQTMFASVHPPAYSPYPVGPSLPPSIPPTKLILDEYTRQYQNLNWMLVIGVFLVGGIIGIAMIAYALIQRPLLRRKVAELGIEPQSWAGPLDADALRVFLIILACLTVVSIIFGICIEVGANFMSQQMNWVDGYSK